MVGAVTSVLRPQLPRLNDDAGTPLVILDF